MRNLFTAGVSFESMARPKIKEAALMGNSQPKERAATGFQKMLHTVCGEKDPSQRQIQDGKPLEVNPKNDLLRKERPLKAVKPTAKPNEKTVAKPLDTAPDLLKDKSKDDSGQSDKERALSAAAQGIAIEMPLTAVQTLPTELMTAAAVSSLPTANVANQSATPLPTPTPTPETTKLHPSLVAAQLDLAAPANLGAESAPLQVMTAVNQAIKQPIPTVSQTAVMPAATTSLDEVNNITGLVEEAIPAATLSGDLAVLPQTGNTIAKSAVQAEVLAVTAATNRTTAVEPNISNPMSGTEADHSQVQTGSATGIAAPSVQTLSANTPVPTVVLPTATESDSQPVSTVQSHVMAPEQSGITDSATAMSPTAATTTDLNRVANYNTVMAGTSLQKNGMASNSVLQQPDAESTPALQALQSLSVPMGALLNSGNRLTKTKQETIDPNNGPAVKSGAVPTETAASDQTLTGADPVAVRKDPDLNLGNAAGNLQAAEPVKAKTQTGLSLGVMQKTAVTSDEVKPAATSKLASEPEAVNKTGKTAPELPGAGVMAAKDNVVQTNQAVNHSEVSTATKNEVFTQIVEQAKVMVHQGQSEMELSLKPDHLGKLKMKIAVEHQVVTAQFTVESEQVKHIIETNLVQLRKSLQEAGVQVENLTVTVGQHDTNANNSQQSNFSGQQNQPQQQQRQTAFANPKENVDHPKEIREQTKSKAVIDLIA